MNGRDDRFVSRETMDKPLPLILLPGMGADARMFAAQRAAFPELRVPAWIEPRAGESLAHYARRLTEAIETSEPCFVGGASFGGMVAIEMAPYLPTRAVFLIGSARSPDAIGGLRHVAELRRAFRLIRSITNIAIQTLDWLIDDTTNDILQQFAETDAAFLQWATRAVLEWEPTHRWQGPIFQIHGDRDWILPVTRTHADVVVPGAGHLLSITHAAGVNRFLRQQMDRIAHLTAIHSRCTAIHSLG
jgi:pimeloyl-ACP methyl ester carboxylesterase